MRVLAALGTRPEIVKLAPVIAALEVAGIEVVVVATGQHDDPALSDVFLDDLGVVPNVRWRLFGDEATRVGEVLARGFDLLSGTRPDAVLVVGDTYTVPLFCLAARRFRVPVAHLEAGLRSFNPTSMEEVNRRVAGSLASIHLAPTEMAARFLREEGIDPRRVSVVGNPVIDSLVRAGVERRPVEERQGVVVTAHRATNVDDPHRLEALVAITVRLAQEIGPVSFPLHPRTRARLAATGTLGALRRDGITLLPPLRWKEMLVLVAGSKLVVTDSGGLQEEASFLGVPVVVLRRSTPRWEGVVAGTSVLAGLDAGRCVDAARRLISPPEQRRVAAAPCPYGDGTTGARVVEVLRNPATAPLLRLDEPDFVGAPC